ncbi:MAG TPA: sensor histidine kinase [Pseudonocardiaceae bacterium]|nr:sensor histidine kinase [Pseudonocardiaceae bacterium]
MEDEKIGGFNGWAWPNWQLPPEGADEPEGRQRTRRQLGPIIGPAVFLFYLVEPISAVVGSAMPTWQVVLVLTAIGVFAASYVYVAAFGQCRSYLVRSLLILWLCLFPVLFAIVLGPDMLIFLTYAVAPALMLLPAYIGFGLGIGSAVSLIAATWVINGTADWNSALILVVLTLGMFSFGGLIRTVRELRAAQGKMARLAVAEERSRLARDLHDVLGHSLTTITVKAGLARRVLESSADRQRAIDEVRDVEELARQAMTDVRATVSGYRTASLAAELVGARAVLSAAGIAADLPRAVDNVTAGLQETFAYVLREGITNVIRHSGATRCQVRLGDTWLEVRDNGATAAERVTSSRDTGGGHGLSGLAERVAAVDGTLEAGPLPEGGFLLRVSVATPPPAPPAAEQRTAPELSGQPAVGLA